MVFIYPIIFIKWSLIFHCIYKKNCHWPRRFCQIALLFFIRKTYRIYESFNISYTKLHLKCFSLSLRPILNYCIIIYAFLLLFSIVYVVITVIKLRILIYKIITPDHQQSVHIFVPLLWSTFPNYTHSCLAFGSVLQNACHGSILSILLFCLLPYNKCVKSNIFPSTFNWFCLIWCDLVPPIFVL